MTLTTPSYLALPPARTKGLLLDDPRKVSRRLTADRPGCVRTRSGSLAAAQRPRRRTTLRVLAGLGHVQQGIFPCRLPPLRRPSSASTSAPPTAFWGATSVRALSRRRRQRQLHHLLVCLRGNSPSSYPHFVCGGRPLASVRQQGSFLLLSHRLAR